MAYSNPDIHLSKDDTFRVQRVRRDLPDEFLTIHIEQVGSAIVQEVILFLPKKDEGGRELTQRLIDALVTARATFDSLEVGPPVRVVPRPRHEVPA